MIKKKIKKSDKDKSVLNEKKIESLQVMIANAEKTILSAKQMLAKFEGGSRTKRNTGANYVEDEFGQKVIYGNFDGQVMIGQDGKQYPVPANYASKSKLIEGDMLKLSITPDGNFVYKQVGPTERKYLMGIVEVDERGNHFVSVEGKKFKVLLAAATYFKIEPGDEVTIVIPRDKVCVWGAIENVLRKAEDISEDDLERYNFNNEENEDEEDGKEFSGDIEDENNDKEEEEVEDEETEEEKGRPSAIEKLKREIEEERRSLNKKNDIFNEWTPDIEELKKEASYPAKTLSEL